MDERLSKGLFINEQERVMNTTKIAIFRVGCGTVFTGPRRIAFLNRLERHTQFEMRGLGIEGSKLLKPTTSNCCTIYVLDNGAWVLKYRRRYAIIAQKAGILNDTTKLFGVCDIEIVDIVDARK